MNYRQQNLLNIIVSEYIKTAQPVGSKLIAQSGSFDLSSATIRHEMAELESTGYIFQPHTSAGRMPTEKGYQFYVDNFLKEKDLAKNQQKQLADIIKKFPHYQPELIKELAQAVAELSQGTVFVGFSPSQLYYTGLSNLFSQPEFVEHHLVCHISRVIDHLDRVVNDIFSQLNSEVTILIGGKNPFGRDCSSIITRYQIKNQPGLLGILGPTRMDYQNNFNLIRFIPLLVKIIK